MKIYLLITTLFFIIQFVDQSFSSKSLGKIFNSPTKNLKDFSFGYNHLLASLFWVRVVQDLEVCEQNSEKTKYAAIESEDNVLGEILERELPPSTCHEGWVYQMLDVITDLDPQFKSVYYDGATFLSVLVDDRMGAQKIFVKGLQYYPDSWEVYYRAGYHELFEMQNPEKAAELLRQCARKGGPKWAYALSAKIYDKLGRAQFAIPILESVLARDPHGIFAPRIRAQLEELKRAVQ